MIGGILFWHESANIAVTPNLQVSLIGFQKLFFIFGPWEDSGSLRCGMKGPLLLLLYTLNNKDEFYVASLYITPLVSNFRYT